MIVPKYSFLTDPGKVREKNEDSFFTPGEIDSSLLDQNGYLFAVADGMGGHEGGQKASSLICSALAEFYENRFNEEEEPWEQWAKGVLKRLIERISHYVYGCRYIGEDQYSGMGSTLTGVLIGENLALVFNIGDSRVYHLSAAKGFYQVSRDHSRVQALIDQGLITSEGAGTHPDAHVITRSLGMSPIKDDGRPDITTVQLAGGDQLILCSDGLSGIVKKDKIAEIMLLSGREIESAARKLLDAALAGGGPDNITIGLVQMEPVDTQEQPMPGPEQEEEQVEITTEKSFGTEEEGKNGKNTN